jgi:hypothetical protein
MHSRKILSAAAVLATAAAFSAVGMAGTANAAGTAGASTTVRATTTAAAAPYAAPRTTPVKVVSPGQLVPTGHGVDLQLNTTDRCVGAPGDWSTCKSVVDGNQPPDTVSIQMLGEPVGSLYTPLYSPLYIGAGKATRMTVTSYGVTYEAQVVTLAGNPGYSTGYVWGAPVAELPGFGDFHVTVYDRAGRILAQS